MAPFDIAPPSVPSHRHNPLHAGVPHYFAPHIEFPAGDPAWIRAEIQSWEQGAGADSPMILGADGRPLSPVPELVDGLVEHRFGYFAGDLQLQYWLRLEVEGAQRRVRIGLLLSGGDQPSALTRGGGGLLQRLTSNCRHQPRTRTFPTRVRELRSKSDVNELITHLLDPGRAVPVVVVSRRARTDDAVADPERVRQAVAGMAEVWVAPSTGAGADLRRAFASRGLDARWSCFDGAVRVYRTAYDPSVDSSDRHPLLLAHRLADGTDVTSTTADWALRTVLKSSEVKRWRDAWGKERAARRPQAQSPKIEVELPVPVPEATPSNARTLIAAPTSVPSPAELEARPSQSTPGLARVHELVEVAATLEHILQDFQAELEQTRRERDTVTAERDALSQALRDRDHTNTPPSTLPDLLRTYVALSNGRLRVTKYAYRKAAHSRYADLGLVAQVLATLVAVGPGFGAIDTALKVNLGKRVRARPKDSPATMGTFADSRRFLDDAGRVVIGDQHLTLGHGAANQNTTLQIYWRRAIDGATEVLYVGEHLPTVSVDT